MIEDDVREVYDAIARFPNAQAEIDVVELVGQFRIEAADASEDVAPHHHAGGRNGLVVRDRLKGAVIAGIVARPEPVRVPSHTANSDDDAGMLNAAVAIQQASADGP